MDRDNRRRLEPMGFNGARVYVGDIGHRIGRHDLQREFEQYGQVLDVWMTQNQNNNGRFHDKKFAFVVFRYAEDADIAVRDKNGRSVCGRKVRVEHAKPPKSQLDRDDYQQRGRGGYVPGRGRGGFGHGGYYNNNNNNNNEPPRQYPSRPYRHRSRSFSPEERSYHRSPPPSHGLTRNRRMSNEVDHRPRDEGDHHRYRYQERKREGSFSDQDHSPARPVKRNASYSPEQRPRKSARQNYRSVSPSPPPRNPQPADSDSNVSRSPSPPPQKKLKKKRKKQSRSRSETPTRPAHEADVSRNPKQYQQQQPPQQYYSSEERDYYEKPAKSHHHKSKKSKSKKKKKSRDLESGEENSSNDSY